MHPRRFGGSTRENDMPIDLTLTPKTRQAVIDVLGPDVAETIFREFWFQPDAHLKTVLEDLFHKIIEGHEDFEGWGTALPEGEPTPYDGFRALHRAQTIAKLEAAGRVPIEPCEPGSEGSYRIGDIGYFRDVPTA